LFEHFLEALRVDHFWIARRFSVLRGHRACASQKKERKKSGS
jgi:hypothetical protein